MKRLLLALCIVLLAVPLVAADRQPVSVTLTVSGMHCGGCAEGITAMLKRTDGVIKADVSYEDGQAIVDYDPAKTSPEKIIATIEKIGYKAKIKQ